MEVLKGICNSSSVLLQTRCQQKCQLRVWALKAAGVICVENGRSRGSRSLFFFFLPSTWSSCRVAPPAAVFIIDRPTTAKSRVCLCFAVRNIAPRRETPGCVCVMVYVSHFQAYDPPINAHQRTWRVYRRRRICLCNWLAGQKNITYKRIFVYM